MVANPLSGRPLEMAAVVHLGRFMEIAGRRLVIMGLMLVVPPLYGYVPGHFYHTGKTKEKLIALTFDDGPGRSTLLVLDLLKRHGIRATFFMEGSQIETYPEIARKVVEAGHEVGNHTYSHFDFHQLKNATPERLEHELAQTEAALQRATGIRSNIVRMPFGYKKNWILPVLKEGGYALVHWSFGEDWLPTIPAELMIRDYVAHARPGAVFLFHDGGRNRKKSLAVLTAVIESLEQQGYRFIPAEEMFKTVGPVPPVPQTEASKVSPQ